MTPIVNKILGHFPDEPGFERTYKKEIGLIALLAPVLIELACTLHAQKGNFLKTYTAIKGWTSKNFNEQDLNETAFALLPICAVASAIFFGFRQNVFSSAINQSPIEEIELDSQTKTLVIIGYLAIATLHGFKLIFRRRQKIEIAKHATAGALALVTPCVMLAGRYEFRWHHMSYGLLAMAPRLRALNFFGALMAADSVLYWIKPHRDNYDFSNIFLKFLPFFAAQLVSLTLLQILSEKLKKEAVRSPPSPDIPLLDLV